MIKYLASVLAAVLLSVTPAAAQTFNWTGLYIGANAGVGMGSGEFSDGCYYCATDSYGKAFGTFGGQVGMNWRVGSTVLGVEGDFNWSTFEHKGILGTDDTNHLREKLRLQWFSTIRARAGITLENTLLYLTAGPAFGRINAPGIEYCCGVLDPTPTPTGNTFSRSGTRVGFAGGAGVEMGLSDGWSIRAEYLYTNFGSATAYRNPVCSSPYLCTVQNTLTTQMVRVGVNYYLGQ